jgi:hypothetical protein
LQQAVRVKSGSDPATLMRALECGVLC